MRNYRFLKKANAPWSRIHKYKKKITISFYMGPKTQARVPDVQGGSNMTGTNLCVNKPHCAAAVRP